MSRKTAPKNCVCPLWLPSDDHLGRSALASVMPTEFFELAILNDEVTGAV